MSYIREEESKEIARLERELIALDGEKEKVKRQLENVEQEYKKKVADMEG